MKNENFDLFKNFTIFLEKNHFSDNLEEITFEFRSLLTWIRVFLTIILRIGFLLVHSGSVPVTNISLIIFQNLLDFLNTTIVFFLVGVVISCSDNKNIIGVNHWIGNVNLTEALIGWQTISTTAAISLSGVIGRLHSVGCLVSGTVLSGILQPFLIHWISKGWIQENFFLQTKVQFFDHSGAAIIHVVGGLSALIGCVILGRRILRLKEIDKNLSPATTVAGYFFIILGLLGINFFNEKLELVLINNFLSSSFSGMTVIVLQFFTRGHLSDFLKSTRCIQGIISGLVVVSGCPDFYSPIATIFLGIINGFIFYGISEIIFNSALEDNCNIFATHLISGFLGSIFTCLSIYKTDKFFWIQMSWQIICLLLIMLTVSIIMVPIFLLLKFFQCLRNSSEFSNHLRSTEALKTRPKKFPLQRIFHLDKEKVIFLKPGIDQKDCKDEIQF